MAQPLKAITPSEETGPHELIRTPSSVRRRSVRLSVTSVFLCVGLAIAGAAATGMLGSEEPTAEGIIGVMTFFAFIYSVLHHRPSLKWPWIVITAALGLFLASGAARNDLHTLGNLTATRSLIPDFLALPGYALTAAGLLAFARSRVRRDSGSSSIVLDGLITSFSLAALAWVFVTQPVLTRHATPLSVQLLSVAYPSMSIFLVVVTLRIVCNSGQNRLPAFWFLVVAMIFMFVGDTVNMLADIDYIRVSTCLIDAPYAFAYLAAGAGALHPSMRKLTERGTRQSATTSRGRIAAVAVALLIPALLLLQRRTYTTADRLFLFIVIIGLTGTAVLRIVQALHAVMRSEARLTFQSLHDSLTGLPNRQMMEQRLSRLLEHSPVDDTHVALLFLDLDRFKLVNDTLGHHHGDDLLVMVAQRLRAHVRPSDLVTRVGGDEFMILLGHVVSISQALDLANRLRFCLRAPFIVNDVEFHVSASIGLVFASTEDPDATAEVLVRDADTAMNQAKDVGRDAVAVFDKSMRTRVSERVELENDLRHAVSLHQLYLVYQPIVRLPQGTIDGLEALVRWSHPTQGVLSPTKFIPLAEESGLIIDIGSWVFDEAVAQLAAWRQQAAPMRDLYISVNLSGAQLHDESLVKRVAHTLAAYNLPGSALCLELTESVVMDNPVTATQILTQLRRLGVHLAIDDFGTEYSSLSYLKRLPVTRLKIDKSFIDSLTEPDSSDATLVAAIVAMARALGITTIAEGVETRIQLKRLLELGCDSVQGYLYSHPVRADRLPEIVDSQWALSSLPPSSEILSWGAERPAASAAYSSSLSTSH